MISRLQVLLILSNLILSLMVARCAPQSFYSNELKSNWILSSSNGLVLKDLTVPLGVHSALMDANITGSVLYGYNDINLRWILYEDWTFTNYFQITEDLNEEYVYLLEFLEIDTIASVYLNDRFILFTNNQFIKYKTNDVRDHLVKGANKLEIQIKSPVTYAKTLWELYPYRVPLECPVLPQKGECHINFLRKQQCSFSWDWGPTFGSIGINDKIYLKVITKFDYDFSISTYPTSSPSPALDGWYLDAKIDLDKSSVMNETLFLVEILIPELGYKYGDVQSASHINYKLVLSTKYYPLKLWYPLSYGEQKLYTLNVNISCISQSCLGLSMMKSKTIAFRSVELVQDPIRKDLEGLTFYFKINNIPVFMKGSNWIPPSAYRDRVDHGYLKWLLNSTAQVAFFAVIWSETE
jgi:beta-mannosidase